MCGDVHCVGGADIDELSERVSESAVRRTSAQITNICVAQHHVHGGACDPHSECWHGLCGPAIVASHVVCAASDWLWVVVGLNTGG